MRQELAHRCVLHAAPTNVVRNAFEGDLEKGFETQIAHSAVGEQLVVAVGVQRQQGL